MNAKLKISEIFGLSAEDKKLIESPVDLSKYPLGTEFALQDCNRKMIHRFVTALDLYRNPIYFSIGLRNFDTTIKILRESGIGTGVHDLRTCFITDPATHNTVAIGWFMELYDSDINFLDIHTLEIYKVPENMELFRIDAPNPKPILQGKKADEKIIKSNKPILIPNIGISAKTFEFILK
ncbi:MAG: hypothetical protein LBL47_04805 [Lactobacillus sp.]|jgi:hypothetical protein|nr:hypothetical protein [Lactobacillus sp.]